MQKLFETRAGSQLYGTATPTSDIDIKTIILPELRDLLIGKKVQNEVIKTNKKAFTKNSSDDIDEEFIPIQVFAKDFLAGQSYALELAWAIDGTHAHQEILHPLFPVFVEELRTRFLTDNVTALIGYSVNQAALYSNKGERLNALRAVEAMFKLLMTVYPADTKVIDAQFEFEVHAKQIENSFPKYIQLTTYSVNPAGDQRPCIKVLEKILPYTSTLETNLGVVKAALKRYGSRADAAAVANTDWKATSHAMRIVNEGISLLTEKKLVFPIPENQAKYLRAIKAGEFEYADVITVLNNRLDILKDLELTNRLTPRLELKDFENWLQNWMFKFYKINSEDL